MIDITHKNNTLRIASAEATVLVSKTETIDAIVEKRVPKGDVLEAARVAGLLGVKKTSDLIPDCHPLPVEMAQVEYIVVDRTVTIRMTVKTIYKTGVEVEAMHGASVVALTMYDMLKPIDKGVEIRDIRLLEKSGGKSNYKLSGDGITAGVIVVSDSVSRGDAEDRSGARIKARLEDLGIQLQPTLIVSDEEDQLMKGIQKLQAAGCRLIVTTGGTGASPRDITVATVEKLITKPLPGIMEQARDFGQQRMPYAMLSASTAGLIDDSLILTFPGSSKAVEEYMDALFPHVLHVFRMIEGKSH